ncbi:hypothetical protein GCM10007036_07510 [Alsobacter metallidurans]|uniref:PilZ domain-containing protein n=1 Tax=Alsobacter metallidurans TaxID=340221 RepID=A0A917I447_9HYPH|nr:PilZ domain-containing protein [Alsobacter metallidurans]GGH10770.1 hypothetical protein GCM10007036_07510 [Alsobacter metallidurans]
MHARNTSILSAITRLFDGQSAVKRAYPRSACRIAARLELPEKAFSIDGMIIEASRGGILFRESSRYILDRRGAPVVVHLPGLEIKGDIVNVSPLGYGVRLSHLISEEALGELLARRAAA